MILPRKKRYIFLASFLFLASTSLDIAYHAYSGSETSQTECQFCNNDISDSVESSTLITTVSLSKLLLSEIKEVFVSLTPKNFQSRAPPKF
jgi:hypothetical protein